MMKKAEITVYLSLVFILLVSFASGILESASIHIAKNSRRGDATRAIECVFAEYQKELLTEYDVFALDGGYESGEYEEKNIDKRLEYYGLVNSTNTIERIQFLSDDNAKVLYEQIGYYMRQKYGLGFIESKLNLTDDWKKQADQWEQYETNEQSNQQKLENLLQESETGLPSEQNPIADAQGLKNTPVLNLVMPEGKAVSEKQVELGALPSHRELNQGWGDFSDEGTSFGTVDKLLAGEYMVEQFSTAADEAGGVLNYEVEYLLAGKKSDRENLKTVVKRLIMLRVVPNYAYLNGNAEKRAEAEAIALSLCALLAVPSITEVVAQGILFAWAYEDSVNDVKTLLAGGKVEFIKQKLSYEGYLKILLFLGKKEEIGMRVLDLIELNLRKIQGLDFFHVDTCITKLELTCKCFFRRGIAYTFPIYFGYQ